MPVKPAKRWHSLALCSSPNGQSAAIALVCAPQSGFWGSSRALNGAKDDHARLLLSKVKAAVESGEDLTAAFLMAHGQVQRGQEDLAGTGCSSVIALRQTTSPGTLELAWVGEGSALMLRKARPINIASDKSSQPQSAKNLLFETQRLEGLGGEDKVRPIIDRNLINVQRQDVVILASGSVDLNAHQQLVSDCFRGFGDLEYKARKLQARLESTGSELMGLCFIQIA